jgi:hypothetical protein
MTVTRKALVPIIPFNGEVLRIGCFDGAPVRLIAMEANAGIRVGSVMQASSISKRAHRSPSDRYSSFCR